MVKGLDVFQEHFAAHSDQFILIGGTAATLVMEQAGLDFRATKDLDIVLHIEALTPAFGTTFWTFIETGGYEIREASDTGKPLLYRFQKPADANYPFMLELFCRSRMASCLPTAVASLPFRSTKLFRVCPLSCSMMGTTTSCLPVAGWAAD